MGHVSAATDRVFCSRKVEGELMVVHWHGGMKMFVCSNEQRNEGQTKEWKLIEERGGV